MKKLQKSQSRAKELQNDELTTFWTFFCWKLEGGGQKDHPPPPLPPAVKNERSYRHKCPCASWIPETRANFSLKLRDLLKTLCFRWVYEPKRERKHKATESSTKKWESAISIQRKPHAKCAKRAWSLHFVLSTVKWGVCAPPSALNWWLTFVENQSLPP